MTDHILIIKHGALGDIILASGPMKAIRQKHPRAHITLLTAKPYDSLLKDCPFIDDILIDPKPKLWHFTKLARLKQLLRSQQWYWVYDLQTSQRSTSYFRFLQTRHYSGLHPQGSHTHDTKERTQLHTIDRQRQQLQIAGIADIPAPDISWLAQDHPLLKETDEPFVLFVPGGSPHRPEKRWPAEHYAALAKQLCEQGYRPVLIGTKAEEAILQEIASTDARIVNLCNATSFAQIASLARAARYAVGNDTGPMHIIAAAGCACTVLFNTTASNPDKCAPRGEHVKIMKSEDLSSLTPQTIASLISQ